MRVAVVGIDGTGKTTVLRRIHEQDDLAVIHAIRAHEDPGSPFAELSTALADASAAADALGRVHLKVAVLYLQLCLYAPAERQALDGGRTVLSDRHPLIDPLVYLPLFGRLGADDEPGDDVEAWWRKQHPDAAQAVRDWLRTCSGDVDPWPLGADLLRLGTLPHQEMLDQLSRRFGVAVPDGVLLLDLPVEQALRRTQERTRGSELHETEAFLSETRRRYGAVLDWLGEARPEIAVRRVDCSQRSVDEVTEQVRDAVALLDTARGGMR
jgi:thymidylate kinase